MYFSVSSSYLKIAETRRNMYEDNHIYYYYYYCTRI